MRRLFALLAMLGALWVVPGARAAPQDFGLESVEAELSSTQAGGHPDLTFSFEVKQDPASEPNPFGLKDSYATTRNVRFDLPPGLVGNPNVLGVPQQCKVKELLSYGESGGGCPNGSQIGRSTIFAYGLNNSLTEPVYMMAPPGGDVVARLGLIAGLFPTFVDLRVRSESDYGLVAEITEASAEARLIKAETTTWGVPADPSHDNERCTPAEVLQVQCLVSESRPPGSIPLSFMTNPTRCGVPLAMSVSASSWVEPDRFDTLSASFPPITGCNNLPFGPTLEVQPTSRAAALPTGLDITLQLAAAEGASVLEPSHMRDIRIAFPPGLAVNPGSAEGLGTCSAEQVRFGTREASQCPDEAKLASTEFEIPPLSRRMKGAIYLREPEPGNPFRVWVVADDLGAHVKLPGQLEVNRGNGQIESIILDSPQVPVREAVVSLFSGARAPLLNPSSCGTYLTHWQITPWSGGRSASNYAPMTIDRGCDTGGFDPKLSGGTTDPTAGKHSPFVFALRREDGEQNPAALDITLPQGLAATFADLPRCEGADAVSGHCPPGSRIGKVIAGVGAGSAPLWAPQPGRRPTAVYLSGPYKGAPFSIVAVVPAQAGPFDFGDEVVRSAIYVDPVKAQGIVRSDPLPQIIEGVPIPYRTIYVEIDHPNFTLNPTSCKPKSIDATVTSSQGAVAKPSTRFQAVDCRSLPFKPKLTFHLRGGAKRGAHPRLRAVLEARPGDANIGAASVALPHSEFLDQAHIGTVCTRVQFAVHICPAASIYGHAVAKTPLLDKPLSGPVYLRSSSNQLPDLVVLLAGEIEVELASRVDSVNGGIRNTFEFVPDAPVTSFVLTLKSGSKGLLVNSTDLCAKAHRATAKFTAQNGRKLTLHPEMQASCGKQG